MTTQTLRYTPLAIALAIFAIASIALARGVSLTEVVQTAEALRGLWWLPAAYLAAYVALDLLCIPTQILSITAAVVWGWKLGGAIELASATIGAVPPYLIARRAFPSWLERREQRIDTFSLLLTFRLVPIIPYSLLNYVAGLSPIPLSRYVAATVIGMIPSTFIFAYFVDSLAAGVIRPAEVFVRCVAAGALLAAFVLATRLAARRLQPAAATPDRAAAPPASSDRD